MPTRTSDRPFDGGGATIWNLCRALSAIVNEIRQKQLRIREHTNSVLRRVTAAPDAETDARIEALETQLQTIAQELDRLRKESVVPEETPLESAHGLGPAASKVYAKDRGLSIGGPVIVQPLDQWREVGQAGLLNVSPKPI